MKIISKHKDYYDYLMGTFGIDDKIVYERSPAKWIDLGKNKGKWEEIPLHIFSTPDYDEAIHGKTEYLSFEIAFCGMLHKCIYHMTKKAFYFNHEIQKVLNENKEEEKISKTWRRFGWNRETKSEKLPRETTINDDMGSPIIFFEYTESWRRYNSWSNAYSNIRLSDVGFAKEIDPRTAYFELSSWLSREPQIENTQSDLEKLHSHGFDKKVSFRHRK